MLKIRPFSNRLFYNMGIPIPGKQPLYILRRDPESFILKRRTRKFVGKIMLYAIQYSARPKEKGDGKGLVI